MVRLRAVAAGIALAGALLLAAGCGRNGGASSASSAGTGNPPPGRMKMVNVVPLSAPGQLDPGNLIVGGQFTTWWAGASAPKGFEPPKDDFSSLTKVGLTDDAFAVEQKWKKPDNPDDLSTQFRAEVGSLTPGAEYLLEVSVAGYVHIDAWEVTDKPVLLQRDVLVTLPGVYAAKRYAAPVRSDAGGTLILAVRSEVNPAEGQVVQWYGWRLTRSDAQ